VRLPTEIMNRGTSSNGHLPDSGTPVPPRVRVIIGPSTRSYVQYQGALWWSPDGTTWTRDALSGANPTYNPVDMRAIRIDDHTVVAAQTIAGSTVEWASTDGKTWTRLKVIPSTRGPVLGNFGAI